jgi:Uma2 family endonuclease
MITDINQLDLTKQYTYADYLTWWFEDRVELIKGYILKMSPAPNRKHQTVGSYLHREISYFLKNKNCQVFYVPFDVRLKLNIDNKEVTTVVQPDICVICNVELLDEQGCNGAPDMIIEILSASNRKHDVVTKYNLYEEAGVKEYWVVYSAEEMIEVYYLENNKYRLAKKYFEDDLLPVQTLEGLVIDLKEIF